MFSGEENDMLDVDPYSLLHTFLNLYWQQSFLEVNHVKRSANKACDNLDTTFFCVTKYFLISHSSHLHC